MKKQRMPHRYIVCNVDGSTHQQRFRIHRDILQAVGQAQFLSKRCPGKKFVVMEAVGGYLFQDDELHELQVMAQTGVVDGSRREACHSDWEARGRE